jgi:hypothetical protein
LASEKRSLAPLPLLASSASAADTCGEPIGDMRESVRYAPRPAHVERPRARSAAGVRRGSRQRRRCGRGDGVRLARQ